LTLDGTRHRKAYANWTGPGLVNDVQKMVAGIYPNYGWRIAAPSIEELGAGSTYNQFYTSENTEHPDKRPQLTVTWHQSATPSARPLTFSETKERFGDTLLAYWAFENDWTDSQRDYDGANFGGDVGFTSLGKIGHAGLFDGSDDYVSIGAPPSLVFEKSDVFSVAVWVYPTSDTSEGGGLIIGKCQIESPYTGWLLKYYSTSGKLYVQFSGAVGGTADSLSFFGSTVLTTETWVHVVLTYDGSATLAGTKLYVDAEEEGTSGTSYDTLTKSILTGAPLEIGARGSSVSGHMANELFGGRLDEVGIWGSVLSPSAVGALYNGGTST